MLLYASLPGGNLNSRIVESCNKNFRQQQLHSSEDVKVRRSKKSLHTLPIFYLQVTR